MLFHEGEGLTLTIETKDGILYRGTAETTEDNMNVSMRDAQVVDADGNVKQMDRVFIRGNQIIFVVFPDILSKSPMFDRLRAQSKGEVVALGLGRGRQQAIMAKGRYIGRGRRPLELLSPFYDAVTRKIVEGQLGTGRGAPPPSAGRGMPVPGGAHPPGPPPFLPRGPAMMQQQQQQHGSYAPAAPLRPGYGGPPGMPGRGAPMGAPMGYGGPPRGMPAGAPGMQQGMGGYGGPPQTQGREPPPFGAPQPAAGRGRGVEMTRPAWMK